MTKSNPPGRVRRHPAQIDGCHRASLHSSQNTEVLAFLTPQDGQKIIFPGSFSLRLEVDDDDDADGSDLDLRRFKSIK